ncbi:MAG: hypothetical protein OCU22_03665 [Canidatus Methanoxibalbensis ujae]|nr:hypothetical protein [Candidatus Methanoxibalbensis ujae]
MMGIVEVVGQEYHAEYGDCVLANAESGSITVVLPAPINLIEFLPSCDKLSRLKDYMKIVESMYVYVKKVDATHNEVVVVAPTLKEGKGKIVLKKQFEEVWLTTDGESWYIM